MNYQKMSRLALDPSAVRTEARLITKILGERATPSQSRFLNRLSKFEGPDVLPMADRERLWSLIGQSTLRSERGGYKASTLINKLWLLRADLAEEDEDFINDMKFKGPGCALTDGQWRKLLALCRQVGEIDHFVG